MKNTNISSQVFTAVREAINELRKEQSIHFQTLSDEKFASPGYFILLSSNQDVSKNS